MALLVCHGALAQSAGNLSPAEANEKGKGLFRAGKYAEAVAVWEEAYFRASGEMETKLAKNLAVGQGKLGRLERVHCYLSFYLQRVPPDDRSPKTEKSLAATVEALSPGRGLVRVKGDEGVRGTVYIGSAGSSDRFKVPFFWYFEPGIHKLTVVAEGAPPDEMDVRVSAGDILTIRLQKALQLPAGGSTGVGGGTTTPVPEPDPGPKAGIPTTVGAGGGEGKTGRVGPWVLIGTGVAAVAAGLVMERMAKDSYDSAFEKAQDQIHAGGDPHYWTDYNNEQSEEAESKRFLARVVDGVGIAVAVAGVVWLAWPQESGSPGSKSAFIPTFSPTGEAGFNFSLSF